MIGPLNVILIPLGSSGDVNPFVALGRALQARGHKVTMITNGHFETLARRSGFAFEPLGTEEDYRAVLELPDIWHPTEGFKIVMQWGTLNTMRPLFEMIESRNVPGETVVAAPVTAFGARIAQEKLGIPLVSVCLQPPMFRSSTKVSKLGGFPVSSRMPGWWNRTLYWAADRLVIDPLLGPQTNAFRSELGLPPVRRFFNEWWYSPERIIGFFPDWFAPPPPDWPAQLALTGFPLYDEDDVCDRSPELEAFLRAGEPPIAFTPGSAMRHGKEFFGASVDACTRLGRRGVLVSPFRDQIPAELPASVCAIDFVPFSRLFPRSAAVVHHGGIGTSSQALAAGVPQLIMPMAHDQFDNAARLERLGVASSLSPRKFRGPAIARALARLIGSDRVSQECRLASERLRNANPFPESCRLIEHAANSPGRQPIRS